MSNDLLMRIFDISRKKMKHEVKCQVRINFEKCQKTPPDSNKIEHIFLSFSITMGQSIYEQNIIVCVSNSSKVNAEMYFDLKKKTKQQLFYFYLG
jgi:hypothetical protein